MQRRILLCCLLTLILGCIDKVTLDNENFTQKPVILAELNSYGDLRVQVSLTTKIDKESINAVEDDAHIQLWGKNALGEDEIVTDKFDYVQDDNTYFAT